jgi:hypothetical protein
VALKHVNRCHRISGISVCVNSLLTLPHILLLLLLCVVPIPPPTHTHPAAEFVGCSPSLSGAIRVNPWSIDAVADAMYSALKTSPEHRHLRHDKHWK